MEILWQVIKRNTLQCLCVDFLLLHSGWLSEHCNDPEEIRRHWSAIPIDTDILLTHGPPYSIMDKSTRSPHLGCRELLEVVSKKVQPKLHVFGHVHGGYGQLKNEEQFGRTLFVNAALCDSKFRIVDTPIIIDLNKAG